MSRPPDSASLEHAETLAGSVDVRTPGPSRPRSVAGRYDILGLLGVGGMGSVYRVRDGQLDEIVALKMLRPELLGDPGMLARFRQEVKLARRITHPNVVRTFDLGEQDGALFLTMELIEGISLAQRLASTGPLPAAEVVRIGLALCSGIAAAHDAGVLHRDLKPDNVLLGRSVAGQPGRVAITDFGIARVAGLQQAGLAHTVGGVVGTPAYMAPEQVQGQPPDARADVYALGTVLFEMLTGQRAWPGDDVFAVALARVTQPPPDPRQHRGDGRVPDALAQVVLRCMQPRPQDRFATAAEVGHALRELHLDAQPGPGQKGRGTLVTPRPLGSTPVAMARTVAVLPFRNAGMPDDAYLAAGLTEEIIDALSVTRGLRVRPFGAVHRFQGHDPREAGRALDVEVVVDGTVRRFGERLRISARAVSVADGFQIWAHKVDGTDGDALVLSDDLARALAQALTVDLGTQARVASTDPEAVDLYLRGRTLLREGWHTGVDQALALLDAAVARAPEDGTILATCALTRARRAFFSHDVSADSLDLALQAAKRAVEVAPHLGEPWVALGTTHLYASRMPAAAQAFQRAAQRAPGFLKAQEQLGALYLEADRLDAALTHLEAALSLDPTSWVARVDLARARAYRGDWDGAYALGRHQPGDLVGAMQGAAMQLRFAMWRNLPDAHVDLPEAAIAVPLRIQQFRDFMESQLLVLRARALTPAQRENLMEAKDVPNPRLRSARCQFAAEVGLYAGDVAMGLQLLREAVGAGLLDVAWLDRCPLLQPLKSDAAWPSLHAIVAQRAAEVLAALDGELRI